MSYRDAKIARDPRAMMKAQSLSGVVNPLVKGFGNLTKTRKLEQEKEQAELKQLRKEGSRDTQEYAKMLANYKKTGRPNLDAQVQKQINDMALAQADAYAAAFGTDATPESMMKWQTQKARDLADLKDLYTFIGTLDADLDNLDQSIDNNTLVVEKDEFGDDGGFVPRQEFLKGLGKGESQVELIRGKDGGFEIKGRSVSNIGNNDIEDTQINLREYHDKITADGTSYTIVDESLTDVVDLYGGHVFEGLDDQITKSFTGQKPYEEERVKRKAELDAIADKKSTAYKNKVKEYKEWMRAQSTTSYKEKNREQATDVIYNRLKQDSKGGKMKSYGKNSVTPRNKDLWEFLKGQGYITEEDLQYDILEKSDDGPDYIVTEKNEIDTDVSYNKYNNIDKDDILLRKYAEYLADSKVMKGAQDETIQEEVKISGGKGNRAGKF